MCWRGVKEREREREIEPYVLVKDKVTMWVNLSSDIAVVTMETLLMNT